MRSIKHHQMARPYIAAQLGAHQLSLDFLRERAAATAEKRRPSISARRESLHDHNFLSPFGHSVV
jgi:hypothetical protein